MANSEYQVGSYSREDISTFNSQSLSSTVSAGVSVSSVSLSTGLSGVTSAGGSLSTVASTNLSNGVSRDTSQSTLLSVTTSTANSG